MNAKRTTQDAADHVTISTRKAIDESTRIAAMRNGRLVAAVETRDATWFMVLNTLCEELR